MEETPVTPEPQEEKIPPFRGLYRYVKISVKTLDKIIIGLIALILIVVFIEMRNPGFNISFDSKGGTDVPSQTQMYVEYLEVPEPPTREGYQFTGWYTDETCAVLWVLDTRAIETDMTLYAGWEKIE
jgi:uncharacterized repeat protein (TIGR02543 family)